MSENIRLKLYKLTSQNFTKILFQKTKYNQ